MSKVTSDIIGSPLPSMVPSATAPGGKKNPPPGEQRLTINEVDWPTYVKFGELFPERHFRFSYDGWSLELMSKSKLHCWFSRFFCFLVVALAEETGVACSSCGGMTCEREDLERGLEPDECFYLTNEQRVRGRDKLDLRSDPPPDLAVEIDLTTDARRRMNIYAALGVPEIWRFDGQFVFIYRRVAEGRYREVPHSEYFPFLAGTDLVRFVEQRASTDESSLVRSFRLWVREQIAKAKGESSERA